jgi:dienelactone hydrolase
MRRLVLIATLATVGACGSTEPATPDVRTDNVKYDIGDVQFSGLLAWDENATGRRPGVLVVHEWWGHDAHAQNQARRLADEGYVAFALDMYGDGRNAAHPEDAQRFAMEATADIEIVKARFNAARAILAADPRVDPDRIAAIGYCFGGSIILGMARAGADLDAVASFHGALQTNVPVQAGQVKARVLVLTGGADPMVPPDQVEAFRKEMAEAGADIRVVSYPGAKHSFTNPGADSHGMDALAYDADADRRSWADMLAFFKELFG